MTLAGLLIKSLLSFTTHITNIVLLCSLDVLWFLRIKGSVIISVFLGVTLSNHYNRIAILDLQGDTTEAETTGGVNLHMGSFVFEVWPCEEYRTRALDSIIYKVMFDWLF